MRKKILIAQLLLLGTLFEMCGNGHTKSPGTTDNAQSSDTTFFVGKHRIYVSTDGICDTTFADTFFVARSEDDSIVFYYYNAFFYCNKHQLELKNANYHFKRIAGNKYTIDHSKDKFKWIIDFQLQDTSTNSNPHYDSLYFNKYTSYGTVVYSDELVGHVINMVH
jgi:hypothetical protein